MNIETERLTLKPSNTKDSEFMFRLMNSSTWKEFIGDKKIHSVEQARLFIQTNLEDSFNTNGYGVYTVSIKSNEEKIGVCGLYNRQGIDGLDIGFAFLPEFEKQGYAFESAKALINFSFKKLNLKLLKAITTENNTASHNLLIKLGFVFKSNIVLPNNPKEFKLYQLKQNY